MVQWHDTRRSSISCRPCRSRKVKWLVDIFKKEKAALTAAVIAKFLTA